MGNRYRKLEARRFFQTSLILLLINLLVFPPWLTAGTPASWTGLGDGSSYNDPNNWNLGGTLIPDGPYDATIASGNGDTVNIAVGGHSLNSMAIGGSDPAVQSIVTVTSKDQFPALTLSTGNPSTGDVLTINNGGVLNVQNGAGATLDLSSGGTVTNSGALNITGGGVLFISNTTGSVSSTSTITNSGTISLGDNSSAGSLVLNGNGVPSGGTFIITGGGSIALSDNSNFIAGPTLGSSGTPTTLQLDESITGSGGINVGHLSLTGNGALHAAGVNGLVVFNLTNWDGSTLSGGQYIADSGSTLRLVDVASSQIQNISNATFQMAAGGLITGDGTSVPLSSLTNITNSTVNVGGLNGGDSSTPFVITPNNGVLTMTANNGGTSQLILDQGSNVALGLPGGGSAAFNLGNGVSGDNGQNYLVVNNGSTLSVGSLANVDANGNLNGGNYSIGAASTFSYSGATISTIQSNTTVSLSADGQILSNGGNALSSLNTNLGTLTLENSASLSVDVSNVNAFTNGTQPVSTAPQLPVGTHDLPAGNGVLNIAGGSTLTIQDHSQNSSSVLNNWGTINLLGDTSGNLTTLAFDAGNTPKTFFLNGTGTLIGNDSFNNTIAGVTGDESLTNNSTIQGSVYINNFETFTNKGTLNAQGSNGIVIDLTSSAPTSGNQDSFINSAGAQINIADGSAMSFVAANSATLTNNGAIYLNGGCGCGGGASLSLIDGFGGGVTFTLAGSGSIVMDSGGANQIIGQFGTESLINGTGHTISGSGAIADFANFTNNGTLLSNVNPNTGQFGLTIDLTGSLSGDPNESFTNNGEVDVNNSSTLFISSLGDKTITNNGTIYLGGETGNDVGFLVLGSSDDQPGTNYTFAGNGALRMTAGSTVTGWNGDENLINNPGHTIFGAGTIDSLGSFANYATLQAHGGTLLIDAPLANWTPGTLTFGTYIADDGALLQLTGINDPGAALTLSGANVFLNGSGRLLDANGSDALVNLSRIDQGPDGAGSLHLTNVGSTGSPYTITTSQLTISADAPQLPGPANATLYLDGSHLTISNGAQGYGDLVSQATSTTGTLPSTGITLVDGSTLAVGNLSNIASAGAQGNANATVALSGLELKDGSFLGSQLTVNGNLTNSAISTDGGSLNAAASIGLSGNSSLIVTGNVNNSASGTLGTGFVSATIRLDASALQVNGSFTNSTGAGLNGGATLALRNGSTGTVLGTFGNGAASSVTIDASTLNTGVFTNYGQVALTNGAALNAATTASGGLNNSGIITLGPTIKALQSVSTHLLAAPNAVNVTGDLFNTSAGIINVNGDGDSVNASLVAQTSAFQLTHGQPAPATGQFANAGQVNLNGQNASITANSFDNQAGGTATFNGSGSSIYSLGGASNEGTMNFNAAQSVVSSSGFTNTGTIHVTDGSDVTFQGVDTTDRGPWTQTAGATTIDAGGTLTASEVDVSGGLLSGGGTIVGDVVVEGDGTISPGDPQSMSIIGDYTQVLPGVMDLNLDATTGDQILVTGAVNLGGTLELTLAGGADSFAPLVSSYKIVTWTAGEQGNFDNFRIGGQTNQSLFALTFDHGTESFAESFVRNQDGSGELDLILTSSAAPEPSTLAMIFGAGLLGAAAAWRRRKRNRITNHGRRNS